jgi:hypothetical protein
MYNIKNRFILHVILVYDNNNNNLGSVGVYFALQ